MQVKLLSLFLTFGTLSLAKFNENALKAFNHVHPRHYDERAEPVLPKRSLETRKKSKFLNKNSEKFVVNGTGIPEVSFDIGESYAGLLPISQSKNESRELFFWFFPSTNPDAGDEVVIW